jgi:hypothetical protein
MAAIESGVVRQHAAGGRLHSECVRSPKLARPASSASAGGRAPANRMITPHA